MYDGERNQYYKILGISPLASIDEIKQAYRKLALQYHPDVNNSSEAKILFLFVQNAYETLISNKSRNTYDAFENWHEKKSTKTRSTEIVITKAYTSKDISANRFNTILWDIEDIIHLVQKGIKNNKYKTYNINKDILVLLVFIDKWVLAPIGLIDYFMKARKLDDLDPTSYIESILKKNNTLTHFPFTSVENYYFNIRTRMNKVIENYYTFDLFKNIENRSVSIIESWINAQNYSIYLINKINESINEDKLFKDDFEHSNVCFKYL